MIRLITVLIVLIALITLARGVLGMVLSGLKNANSPVPRPEPPPSGGELKRDAVCGTFVPVSSSVKHTHRGETLHFCSATCRDEFVRTRG